MRLIKTRSVMMIICLLSGFCLLLSEGVYALNERVQYTPHNLSISGSVGKHFPAYQSPSEIQICAFCHAPHHASGEGPLWSRSSELFTATYKPYESTTLKGQSLPGQPTGASRLCLSCHDGTIALGKLTSLHSLDLNSKITTDFSDPRMNTNLGTDLSDDHPISFPYDFARNYELHDPSTLALKGVKLSGGNVVECTSCHDPHNNQYGNFLVLDSSTQHDALCVTCHNKAGWSDADSTHRTGGVQDLANGDLVKADGCLSCHYSHSAPGPLHLLKSPIENGTCVSLTCHVSIKAQLDKTYAHKGDEGLPGTHKLDEIIPATQRHVVCVDCHNPHQAGFQGSPLGATSPAVSPASTAPAVNGPLRGVRGVSESGDVAISPAVAEYQICFRCHASTSGDFKSFGDRPLRQIDEPNESIRFAAGNQSYHPVIGLRKRDGRSLLLAYQPMVRMYCSDCHTPHGSNEAHLLKARNWETFPSIETTYPLCFTCHDPDFLFTSGPTSANLHRSHVLNHPGKLAPCAACHDPHGVATNTHLINFDTRYTGAGSAYNEVARSCSVAGACHTVVSPNQVY